MVEQKQMFCYTTLMGVTRNGRRFVPHFRGHCVPLSIHRPYIKDHVQRRGCQWVLQIYLAYWASAWHALVPDTHSVKIKAQKNNRPVSKQYGYFLTKLWGANRLSVTPFFYMYSNTGTYICQFLLYAKYISNFCGFSIKSVLYIVCELP